MPGGCHGAICLSQYTMLIAKHCGVPAGQISTPRRGNVTNFGHGVSCRGEGHFRSHKMTPTSEATGLKTGTWLAMHADSSVFFAQALKRSPEHKCVPIRLRIKDLELKGRTEMDLFGGSTAPPIHTHLCLPFSSPG